MSAADAAIAHLSILPWCRALLTSPLWTITRTTSRIAKAAPGAEDSFTAETLATARTIRTSVTLRSEVERADALAAGFLFPEVRTLLELGDGLNGFPSTAHGGFLATALDEVMGVLITTNMEEAQRRKGGDAGWGATPDGRASEVVGCFTAYLNVTYKKPVPTPGVLLCAAAFDRRERNKIYIRGTIEDGEGTVYTTGEGLFVEVMAKL